MVDPENRSNYTALLEQVSHLRSEADRHAKALSHLHALLRDLEAEMSEIVEAPEGD